MRDMPIATSVLELFKRGPGPSSSHTIGPMLAARQFVEKVGRLPEETLALARAIEVRAYGSLAATGKGHGPGRAGRTSRPHARFLSSHNSR